MHSSLIRPLYDLKFEPQLLAAHNVAQILLPKLTEEPHFVVFAVEVYEELDAKCLPQTCEGNITIDGL